METVLIIQPEQIQKSCIANVKQMVVKFYFIASGSRLWQREWISKVQLPHQHIIGHFIEESFQSVTCIGTDNLTKRQNVENKLNNTCAASIS